jgi:uncharacterized protein with HEPN domain
MFIDDKTRVRHMIDAAEEAVSFAAGRAQDDIRYDRALALVLVKCLEMLGEAGFRTSRNYRDLHPEVPWKVLIDLRNHLVHEYHDIDVERVWSTIRTDISSILPALRGLLIQVDADRDDEA